MAPKREGEQAEALGYFWLATERGREWQGRLTLPRPKAKPKPIRSKKRLSGLCPRLLAPTTSGQLCPLNDDSGQESHKRFIQGGRKRPRGALYMASLSANRYNPS